LSTILVASGAAFAEAWNFGADPDAEVTVQEIVELLQQRLGPDFRYEIRPDTQARETRRLKLDSAKARARLGWSNRLSFPDSMALVAHWYRAYRDGADMRKFLVVLDDTRECLNAMRFAAMRASRTGGGVKVLAVIPSEEFSHWVGVGEIMREESRERIRAHFEVFAKWMRDRQGVDPELAIREGTTSTSEDGTPFVSYRFVATGNEASHA